MTPLSTPVMDETLGGSQESRMRLYFDAIDKARELLESHADLSNKVPTCVVVGMQSVGKSAILSRLSGIPFPQDSEVCTRVATELCLRRSVDGTPPGMSITAGKEPMMINSACISTIENALKQAQHDILGGREFEDKVSIKIDKAGPNLPDVTLVDLPGVFFAKDKARDTLEEKVKSMIAKRVNNDMTLICHVVPLNQDSDTISTWRMVRDADPTNSRTIPILTKGDLAMKDGKESIKHRLQKVIKDSESECFLIHGLAKSYVDEENKLTSVSDLVAELRMTDHILIGAQALHEHIEKRMLDHIKDKIPEMKGFLEKELKACKAELDKTGRTAKTPILIAMNDMEAVLENLTKKSRDKLPWLRNATEEMARKVVEVPMEPLGILDMDMNTVNNELHKRAGGRDLGEQARILHALALEAKKLQKESREHINVPFVGKERELEQWLSQFLGPCSELVEGYVKGAFSMYRKEILQYALDFGLRESTKKLERKVEAVLNKKVVDALEMALERAREICEGACTNLFTANDHYLTDTLDALKTKHTEVFIDLDADYAADMKPHFDNVYAIMAFIKTRKKLIPDAVQIHTKLILESLQSSIKDALQVCMMEDSSLALISEPVTLVRKRKFNLEREQKIEKVFEELRFL